MPKLPRVTAKIFASNAATDDIGQYGSALTGTKVLTNDIETIQALPAYEEGWRGAVISNRNYPTLQEMNGLQKTFSQQIAYTLETGIPEWDSNTTYYANTSFCQVDGVVYQSLTNENIGNNPTTDATNWVQWGNDSNKANTSLDNLTPEGEKHFLGKQNITNCLTDVPQMIKADIVDGTLTVYAGSRCIVPYGTEAPTYSIGDFLLGEANNNLYKIVDIQYDPTDKTPELYYWCELQRDVSKQAPATSSTQVARLVALNISGEPNSAGEETPLIYNAKSWSQDTLPTDKNGYQWYQPTNNKCVHVTSAHAVDFSVQSFPILKVINSTTQVYGSIIQTFDSMGYIGLLRWYDKSLAGLGPDGFNTDGSYNNVIANPIGKLVTINSGAADRVYVDRLYTNSNGVGTRQYQYTREVENFSQVLSLDINTSWCVYVKNLNKIFINQDGEWQQTIAFYASEVRINTDGVIEDFAPRRVFRAADANELDGKWTSNGTSIFENLSFAANQERTYDLSQYLPDDNNVYEVLFFCYGRTGTASGNTISMWLGSSVCPNTVICSNQTRTTSYMYASNSLTIPIGQDRVLKVSALNQIGTATNVGLQMKVYRKVR